MDFLPDVGEVARVIEDRLVENLGVTDAYYTAGELPTVDPHGGRRGLDRRRLAHLEDGGLKKTERNYVAAHSAHGDAIADGEGVPAQDNEVAGERRNHTLK